jgi:hypothetical protein
MLSARTKRTTQSTLRIASLADAELSHLECLVKRYLSREELAVAGLDRAYWLNRIASLEGQFSLLPTQQCRLRALSDWVTADKPTPAGNVSSAA